MTTSLLCTIFDGVERKRKEKGKGSNMKGWRLSVLECSSSVSSCEATKPLDPKAIIIQRAHEAHSVGVYVALGSAGQPTWISTRSLESTGREAGEKPKRREEKEEKGK